MSKVLRVVGAAVMAIAALTTLTGCGFSPCEKAGGQVVLTHYTYQSMVIPNGSGGTTVTMQPIPHFACKMEGVK